ncbi:hypothetical protein ACGF13_04935 [Kitasatospora sp. NPDC048286]|uniref:hypothetical protein n=1 Tax=Kitasatospora sp. NPDC048286 TaxID=3364047 RepID=UPI00371D67AA
MEFRGRAVLAVGGVLLLAACSGGGGEGAAAPSASATPYGTVLSQALEPVGTGLGKVAAATTARDAGLALSALQSNADRAVRGVQSAAPPAGAEAARADLVAGLNALSAEASKIREDVFGYRICSAGFVQAKLGVGPGLTATRAAVAKLAAAGHQAVLTVPKLPEPQPVPRALENGAVVTDGGNQGKGELTFENGGQVDAVVSIVLDGRTVASAYVAKGRPATISGVKEGSYDFHVTIGVDWDSEARQFTQNCLFANVGEKREFGPGGTTWTVKVPTADGRDGADVRFETVESFPQP